MKNKTKLKKNIKIMIISLIIFSSIFLGLLSWENYSLNKVTNSCVALLISKVKEKYPLVSDEEIINILEYKKIDENLLNKYGILTHENIIKEENNLMSFYTILNTIFLICSFLWIVFIFWYYEKKKNKEIDEISHYITEINQNNYSLDLDNISEDELSILKNEIYKTTVMLKENAENSLKDKTNLKNSLEDISHQLKTPLTSILIMLDDLLDNENMPKNLQKEFLHDMKREVLNLNFLVQNILKLSKFDASTITFTKNKFKVKDLIKEVEKNVAAICDLKNITLNIKGTKEALIYGDFKWQTEALTNILKNAIEYSKEFMKINIGYEENNAYTEIVIKDFGKGIEKEDLPHIFERFYKGKNASSESVGIGLALAKMIIEKDGGTISVTSDFNETTFSIKYFHI